MMNNQIVSAMLTRFGMLAIGCLVAVAGFFAMPNAAHALVIPATGTVYQDSNNDGRVDNVRISFTAGATISFCNFEPGDWSIGAAGSINITSIISITNTATCDTDDYIDISVTATDGITGGVTNPRLDYTNNLPGNNSILVNGEGSATNFTATDAAKPIVTIAATGDNNADGTIDRLALTFSESVTITDGGTDNDFTLVASTGTATITAGTYGATASTLTYTIATSATFNTSMTVTPTYATAGAGSIIDSAANEMLNAETVAGTDGAKPVTGIAATGDSNNDGSVDRLALTFSESVTITDGGTDNDFTLVASTGTATITAGTYGATASTLTYVITTSVTGDTSLTVTPTYATAGAGSIIDASANEMSNGATTAASDGASPVVLSSTPTNGATGVLRTSSITLVFSEIVSSLTTSITGGVALTNGGLGSATVVLSGTKIAGSNTLTILTAPDASANAFNRFASSGTTSISFTVNSGSSSSSSSSTPLTYDISFSAPAASAAYAAGDVITITWSTDGGTGTVSAVNLDYSTDGGSTFTSIVSGTTNDGSYDWTAPDISEQSVAIRGQATDLLTVLDTDTSDAFSIGIAGSTTSDDTTAEDVDTSENSTELLPAGTYFKGESWATVYYVDGLTRRPFLDAQTFFTYADSFDEVIETSDEYLANYSMGTPMLPKIGTVLVKIQSVSKVYALTAESTLRWITSESLASSLYGGNWADYVIDVPVTAWGHFTIGEDVESVNDIEVDESILETRDALSSK